MENRPGAGTIIGTTEAARAAPDGYTLLMISATQTTVETLNPNKPYKLMRDFVPVAVADEFRAGAGGATRRSPVNNLAELIALAKAKPGTLNYGSSGLGSNYHMAGELVKNLAGLDIVHVPYKGSHRRAQRHHRRPDRHDVRLRADHGADDRGPAASRRSAPPGACVRRSSRTCPTSRRPAFLGMNATIWIGVMAPAGTPQAIVDLLNTRDQQDPCASGHSGSRGERQGANPMIMKPDASSAATCSPRSSVGPRSSRPTGSRAIRQIVPTPKDHHNEHPDHTSPAPSTGPARAT